MAGDTLEDTPRVITEELRDEEAVEPPPDGGYGWVVVGACFTINCFSWGVTSVSTAASPMGSRRANVPASPLASTCPNTYSLNASPKRVHLTMATLGD
jgi:hypothetical protein